MSKLHCFAQHKFDPSMMQLSESNNKLNNVKSNYSINMYYLRKLNGQYEIKINTYNNTILSQIECANKFNKYFTSIEQKLTNLELSGF